MVSSGNSTASKSARSYLLDIDGVLVTGNTMIAGADRFIDRLRQRGVPFLVLTNNPIYTPGDLSHRLSALGLDIPAGRLFTSAMATARFLQSQQPNGTAFVIGESGLTSAIHEAGYVITDLKPSYLTVFRNTEQAEWQTVMHWSSDVRSCCTRCGRCSDRGGLTDPPSAGAHS